MVDIKYANAYSEVLEILKYIPIEDYNKIPNSKIKLFETNHNKEYIFRYNPNKTLEEQNVSKTAKAIIAILFRDYWATELQKEKIISKQNYDRMKLEEQKREKYDVDNIFKSKDTNIVKDNIENDRLQLVEYKESFFTKFTKFIKNLFEWK